MRNTDYIVIRFEDEQIEVLAVDSSFAMCENVIREQSRDADDLLYITRYSEATDDLKAAAIDFLKDSDETVVRVDSREHNRQRSYTDFSGFVSGKPFRVQIDELELPRWYDSALDSDEQSEVLTAIEEEDYLR